MSTNRIILLGLMLVSMAAQARLVMRDGITYSVRYDEAEVVGPTSGPLLCRGTVVIPDSIYAGDEAYAVTSVAARAFCHCTRLDTLLLPAGVDYIGQQALMGSSVQYVQMPDSLYSIDDQAFQDCYQLRSLVIPEGVDWIGDWALQNCGLLDTLILPESLTDLGRGALQFCSTLRVLHLNDSCTTVDANTIYGCTAITEPVMNSTIVLRVPTDYQGRFVVPEGVEEIAEGAMNGCSQLTELVLPSTLQWIEKDALKGCTSLRLIDAQALPESPWTPRHWLRDLPEDYQLLVAPGTEEEWGIDD